MVSFVHTWTHSPPNKTHIHSTSTIKEENCAVVLLMDDTPTIYMCIYFCGFSIFVYFCVQINAGVKFLLCGKPLPASIA